MGRDNSNKVWIESDELFSLQSIKKEHKKLPTAVFLLCQDAFGNKFLQRLEDQFQFNYKMYGLETALIDRVLKTFKGTNGNLGILLNGIKGTGKTVTSKIICNELANANDFTGFKSSRWASLPKRYSARYYNLH